MPESIEEGIVQYFKEMSSEQRGMIQTAIEKNMPEILIRRMFIMKYEQMKQFYDSYFN